MELDPQIRPLCEPGGIVLFSGAQLHSSVPNTSTKTRFSIDLRTVHVDDAAAGRGAPNIDSECTGTTMGDYLRSSDLAHVPDNLVAEYDTPPRATAKPGLGDLRPLIDDALLERKWSPTTRLDGSKASEFNRFKRLHSTQRSENSQLGVAKPRGTRAQQVVIQGLPGVPNVSQTATFLQRFCTLAFGIVDRMGAWLMGSCRIGRPAEARRNTWRLSE